MKYRMTPFLLAVALGSLLASIPVHARTWTSSVDASRKFEADFVKYENDVVTVKLKSGTPLSFPFSTISKTDQTWVLKKTGAGIPDPTKTTKTKPILNLSTILDGKLVKVDDDGKANPFAYAEGETPEYYIIYASAYW